MNEIDSGRQLHRSYLRSAELKCEIGVETDIKHQHTVKV